MARKNRSFPDRETERQHDEAYDYGYQLGKGINNAGEIAVSIVTAGAGSAVALAKLKPLLKSLSKLTKGTKNEEIIKDALEGAGKKDPQFSDKLSPEKWEKQYSQRGWNKDSIQDTVDNPHTTREGVNRTTGNTTTVYYNKDGSHVIVDNGTGKVIQVSDKTDPNWVPDPSINNPYIPK